VPANDRLVSSHTESVGTRGRRVVGFKLVPRLAAVGLVLAGVIGAASLADGAAGALTSSNEAPATAPQHCAALEPLPSAINASAPSSGPANTTTVAIEVPPIVDVVLGSNGQSSMARTNTGTGPSCTDYFYIFSSPGNTIGHRGDLAQVNQVMAMNHAGSWNVGVWRGLS
jgi:hypothetical protein